MSAARLSRMLLFAAVLFTAARSNQGGSAVITLVMPPPGGEGYAALQSGVALAEGATAAYYNPAALAELHRSTGTSLGATYSRQSLLPMLHLPDLYQDFQAVDLVFADPGGGADLGVGMFRNHISFGKNTPSDPDEDPYDSYENVWGLATGVRLGFCLSLGLAAKFIDSHLAQGTTDGSRDDGIARSWAFDFGILAMPRFGGPDAWGVPIAFTPSAGITLANVGPDVFYLDVALADPIPRTLTCGLGLAVQAWDLVSATAHLQAEQEWTRRSDGLSPVYHAGILARLLWLETGVSWLDDEEGKRLERFTSLAFAFDWLAWARVRERMRTGDWMGPGDPGSGRTPLWKPFGTRIAMNPRFTAGLRGIEAFRNGVRDGQTAWYLAFSM